METTPRSEPTRCTATLDVAWGGDEDTLRCTKDEGHGAFVWSSNHPKGAHCPSEHRFVIEVEQGHPHV